MFTLFVSLFNMIDSSKYNIVDVVRTKSFDNATLGVLFVNNSFFCYTLEPYFSPEFDALKSYDFKAQKEVERVYRRRYLACPSGVYNLFLNRVSPLYLTKSWSKSFCNGLMPYVDTKSHDGLLIHPGNYAKDTRGCVLVGSTFSFVPAVFNSIETFKRLYTKLKSFKQPIKIRFSYVCELS